MNIERIKVKDIEVDILRKSIKNMHVNVLPDEGYVRVSVPENMSNENVRLFILKKYQTIKKYISEFQAQERQTQRQFVSGESHYFKGKRYLLKVLPSARPKIVFGDKKYIIYYVPENYTIEQRQKYYEKQLRKELKSDLDRLIPKWEKNIGVKTNEVGIKKMKTKWGSCNPLSKKIWINLELIKKPEKHLEYIIVHELIHLIESSHNENFVRLLHLYFPAWKKHKEELNAMIL